MDKGSIVEVTGRYVDMLVAFLPNLVRAVIVVVAFWIASLIAKKVLRRFAAQIDLDEYILRLLSRVVSVMLVLLGVVTALDTLGFKVSALVASLGLTGFALGFALRDALSNLLAGILILVYRPFQVNDRISVAGQTGVVVKIDLRYTTIDADGKIVLLPNATLFTNAITLLKEQ